MTSWEPAGTAPAINRLFIGTYAHLHSHPCPGWDLNSPCWVRPPCSYLHLTHHTAPSSLPWGSPWGQTPGTPVQSRAFTPQIEGGLSPYMYSTAQAQLSIKHSAFLSLWFGFFSPPFLKDSSRDRQGGSIFASKKEWKLQPYLHSKGYFTPGCITRKLKEM